MLCISLLLRGSSEVVYLGSQDITSELDVLKELMRSEGLSQVRGFIIISSGKLCHLGLHKFHEGFLLEAGCFVRRAVCISVWFAVCSP